MFVWAATGSPTPDPAATSVQVIFVDGESHAYSDDPDIQEAMRRQGTISFRMCFSTARIPAEYVISLAAEVYAGGREPRTFEDAFDHWMLTQILTSIGGHTMR
ncbi:hypothetical protein OF83DRAFT_1087743 [Amylostereum chailletii]|nr:hypothetical protein OF83DRAFT_1087743 [Amylostereum chailletii]